MQRPETLLNRLTTSVGGADALACGLCAHRCTLRSGQTGRCGTIISQGGALRSLADGRPVVLHADPIERKPLYHVLPDTRLLSLGTLGCTMTCDFCQNWRIAQAHPSAEGAIMPPEAVIAAALARGCAGIAFTYNEPTVYLDYAAAIMTLAKQAGMITIFKTNGYLTREALDALTFDQEAVRHPSPREGEGLGVRADLLLDAANVDLKSFDDRSYHKMCGARLQPVLDSIEHLHRRGVWVEVTTLLIPGVNDGDGELRALATWLASVNRDIPWHLWRFHPDYRMVEVAPTRLHDIERAMSIGRDAGLRYVYASNAPGDSGQHTYCPGCGATLIERMGNATTAVQTESGRCTGCGWRLPGIFGVHEVT